MSELTMLRRQLGGRTAAAGFQAHVTAVAAGKGGVGVSTMAVLLALAKARMGLDVLLVDAAAGPGGLCSLLDLALEPEPAEPVLVPLTSNLTLALAPAGNSGAEQRVLYRRVQALFDGHDAVIVDAGASMTTIASALAGGAGELCVVAAPDRVTLAASYALLKVACARGAHVRTRVMVNCAGEAEASAAYRALRTGAERFLGRTPAFGGALAREEAIQTAVEQRRLLATDLAALHTLSRMLERNTEPSGLRVL